MVWSLFISICFLFLFAYFQCVSATYKGAMDPDEAEQGMFDMVDGIAGGDDDKANEDKKMMMDKPADDKMDKPADKMDKPADAMDKPADAPAAMDGGAM